MASRAEILKHRFQNSVAVPFEQVLPEAVIQQVLEAQGIHYRQTLYTPIVVVWAWISQVLDADKSLSNAVNRVIAWLAAAGEEVPSADTGAYSTRPPPSTVGSTQTLVEANGGGAHIRGEARAAVVWATGKGV